MTHEIEYETNTLFNMTTHTTLLPYWLDEDGDGNEDEDGDRNEDKHGDGIVGTYKVYHFL